VTDDDRLLTTPGLEFGSGVIGVCDICGKRQAVIVLQKERYKLCVIDFLNKTWIKSDKTPGAPLPAYRSERIWFESSFAPDGRAPAVLLSPTKVVKHPTVLITPDVYGLTTTLLDGAIRFAREGFEVLLPDVAKISSVGASSHFSLRLGTLSQGGVPANSARVGAWLDLYQDALQALTSRPMVDATKTAVFGVSYGGALALALAARNPKVSAVALAYPMPVKPADLARAVAGPIFYVGGSRDRSAMKARDQLRQALGTSGTLTVLDLPNVQHHFLARESRAYDLPAAERAWAQLLGFLKQTLMPPPPKPPAPPVKVAPPVAPSTPATGAPPVATPAPGNVPAAPPVPTGPTPS
jgi:carboxymethylenebutenolidase